MTLAGEADYVVRRFATHGAPSHVTGGAVYVRYQFAAKFAAAARGEYPGDRGGLFSGATQELKETTVTADYLVANGLLVRAEWRRDFSNRPFFLASLPNVLRKEQNTATLGLIWWLGTHTGPW